MDAWSEFDACLEASASIGDDMNSGRGRKCEQRVFLNFLAIQSSPGGWVVLCNKSGKNLGILGTLPHSHPRSDADLGNKKRNMMLWPRAASDNDFDWTADRWPDSAAIKTLHQCSVHVSIPVLEYAVRMCGGLWFEWVVYPGIHM